MGHSEIGRGRASQTHHNKTTYKENVFLCFPCTYIPRFITGMWKQKQNQERVRKGNRKNV